MSTTLKVRVDALKKYFKRYLKKYLKSIIKDFSEAELLAWSATFTFGKTWENHGYTLFS